MQYRMEIISNQSVEEDITDLLEQEIPEIEYTVVPVVHGRGVHAKKLGTTSWPETNFLLFAYIDEVAAKKAKAIISAVKKKFSGEGISLFFTEVADI